MRLKYIIILIGIFSFLIASCKSTKSVGQSEAITNSGNVPDSTARKDNATLFIEANKEKILGNYDKAERMFLACLQMDPEDAASMFELARIYHKQEKITEAISYAEKAAKVDPDNIYYQQFLANLYKQNNQLEEAVIVLENLTEKFPYNWEYKHDLALTYLFLGNYKNAIGIYDELEKDYGIAEEFSIQKHKIYLLQNDTENAIKEIEKLCEAFPAEAKYYAMLAELYLSNGEDEKALDAYNKILEIDPGNPYVNISLSDYYRKRDDKQKSYAYLLAGFANPNLEIDTKINILLSYYTAQQFYDELKEEAFELSEILIETHPYDPKAYSIYADLLVKDEQYEKAKEAFHKVIELDSTKYLVWEQLLFTEAELSNWESMSSESSRAIALFPHQPLPYLFSAVASFQLEDYNRAINHLETGMKFVVDNDALLAQFYSYLGDAYHQADNNAMAYKYYERALVIDPTNSIVLNNYAYYLSLEDKDLEKALEMAKKAVELDPDNSSNQDTYGWVFFKLGRYDEAEYWIKKSIDNHQEENAEVLEHYGDVLYKLGRTQEALKYWKRAKNAGEGASDLLDEKIKNKKLSN